jgi:hypothetical protein
MDAAATGRARKHTMVTVDITADLPGLFDDYEALVRRVRRLDDLRPGSPRA